jgi:DNA-binding XRE family transcriptional regulator
MKNFKHDRIKLKVSQLDMATLINVSRNTYAKWEDRPDTMPLGKYEETLIELERLKQLSKKKRSK